MTYQEMTKKYEERGLTDYQLGTLEELKEIHGVDVQKLSGYSELSEENKNLFDMTVVRFYNAHELKSRLKLKPKAVYYSTVTNYYKRHIVCGNETNEVAVVVSETTAHSGKKHKISKIVINENIPLSECRKYVQNYFCFLLKGLPVVYITKNGSWY